MREKQDTWKKGSMMMVDAVDRSGELQIINFWNNKPTAADQCRNIEVGIYTATGTTDTYTYRKVVKTNELVHGFNTVSKVFSLVRKWDVFTVFL